MANRKERLLRNLGGTFAETPSSKVDPFFDGPQQAEQRTSVVLTERIIRAVLLSEVDRLKDSENIAELRRFFSHFFDPTITVEERESFVANFQREPPVVVLGYPRNLAELPIFSIVLSSDEEAEPHLLAKYVGATLDNEKPPNREDAEYEGAYFNQMNSVYIYAQHPDVCLYMYHFAKLALFGARSALECSGLIDPHYSGGELAPEEMPYLPDNVFVRVLNIRYLTMMTVPRLYAYRDGRRITMTGIFREDVVIDGQRGGVKTFAATEEEDG